MFSYLTIFRPMDVCKITGYSRFQISWNLRIFQRNSGLSDETGFWIFNAYTLTVLKASCTRTRDGFVTALLAEKTRSFTLHKYTEHH